MNVYSYPKRVKQLESTYSLNLSPNILDLTSFSCHNDQFSVPMSNLLEILNYIVGKNRIV